jgi:transposase-like protein
MSRRSFFCAFVGIAAINFSYRDLEEMMSERGICVNHMTIGVRRVNANVPAWAFQTMPRAQGFRDGRF